MLIQSQRICLHEFRESDALALYKYRSKKEVEQYQSFKNFTFEDAKKTVILKGPRRFPGDYQLGIYLHGCLIGDMHFHITEQFYSFLGYTLDSTYWHNGYGYEACRVCLDYLSQYLNIHHFYLYIDNLNTSSIRLAYKLGFNKIDEQLYYLNV